MSYRESAYFKAWDHITLFDSAQDALHKFYAVLNHCAGGVYLTDGFANTILFNRAYQTISGLSPEDMLHKNLRELTGCSAVPVSGTLLALKKRCPVTIE